MVGFEWQDRQGTTRLGVQITSLPDLDPGIVATFAVQGVPAGCQNTIFERYQVAIDGGPTMLGEIIHNGLRLGQGLLQKIQKTLREQPNAQLYVLVSFEDADARQAMRTIEAQLTDKRSKAPLERSRITFRTANQGIKRIAFWLVPPGTVPPNPG